MVEQSDARRNNCMPGVMMDDDDEDDNDDDMCLYLQYTDFESCSSGYNRRVDLGTLNYYCGHWLCPLLWPWSLPLADAVTFLASLASP